MEDAAGNISNDVRYTLAETSQGMILTVEANNAWINDTDRVFPVMIDPTLTATTETASDDIYSTYVLEENPDVSYYEKIRVYVGGLTPESEALTYIYIHNLPELPAGSELVNANISLRQSKYEGNNCNQFPIALYEVTTEKPSSYTDHLSWFEAITWNNKPSFLNEWVHL